jgi:hypothetical protein
MSDVTYTPRRSAWDIKWHNIGLGTVYGVKPDLKLILDPIKRGTTGKIILGHWIIGLEGSIKAALADVTRQQMEIACPWFAGVTGVDSVPLTPMTVNTNLYSYAQELILHPHDLPATSLKEDIHLIKAVPMQIPNMDRDGEKDDAFNTEFTFYPDLSRLQASPPVLVYGYIGDTAI